MGIPLRLRLLLREAPADACDRTKGGESHCSSTELCGEVAEYSGLLDDGEFDHQRPIRSYGPHYASIQSTVKRSLLSFTNTATKAAFSRRET